MAILEHIRPVAVKKQDISLQITYVSRAWVSRSRSRSLEIYPATSFSYHTLDLDLEVWNHGRSSYFQTLMPRFRLQARPTALI